MMATIRAMVIKELVTRADGLLMDALSAAQRDVLLVSPFITIRVAQQLAELAQRSNASWSLLTRLDPVAVAGGFLTVNGLRQLSTAGVEIRDATRLHAKVYIGDDDFGLLGSANLTSSALGGTAQPNRELSVTLDKEAIQAARQQVAQWWEQAVTVDEASLAAVEKRARELPRAVVMPLPDEPEAARYDAAQLIADASTAGLWVKAQYGVPNPAAWHGQHWFSSSKRGKPTFKPGDLVLIYAKDTRECYAVVEILDESRFDPEFVMDQGYPAEEAQRWPWVNRTAPRLVPTGGLAVSPADLGFNGQGLQGGHRRLGLPEFVAAVRSLSGEFGTL